MSAFYEVHPDTCDCIHCFPSGGRDCLCSAEDGPAENGYFYICPFCQELENANAEEYELSLFIDSEMGIKTKFISDRKSMAITQKHKRDVATNRYQLNRSSVHAGNPESIAPNDCPAALFSRLEQILYASEFPVDSFLGSRSVDASPELSHELIISHGC